MSVTLDLWHLAGGAVAGASATLGARGRNRVIKGAAIGAVTLLIFGILRGLL